MATSTLRFVVIVAFVIAGAVLIAQFPDSSTSVLPTGTGSPEPTQSASPAGGGQQNNGGGESTPPPVEGVKVAVYNGTFQTGLASETALKLEQRLGVKINPDTSITDAPSKPVDTTTIYYVSAADKAIAQELASFFKKIPDGPKVQRLPANATVPPGVQIAVYLGTDYVNAT